MNEEDEKYMQVMTRNQSILISNHLRDISLQFTDKWCPYCGELLYLNRYHLAIQFSAFYFCKKCNIHLTRYLKFVNIEDVVKKEMIW